MSKPLKTLIHTALPSEARPLIQTLKLQQNSFFPKIYENDETLLIISGMGKSNTLKALTDIFQDYTFERAINVGIAGCRDETYEIGTLFCTTHELWEGYEGDITTVETPLDNKEALQTLLVDMECEHFLKVATKHLPKEQCMVFKVVSDYCNASIPKKSFVIELIQKHVQTIQGYIK